MLPQYYDLCQPYLNNLGFAYFVSLGLIHLFQGSQSSFITILNGLQFNNIILTEMSKQYIYSFFI